MSPRSLPPGAGRRWIQLPPPPSSHSPRRMRPRPRGGFGGRWRRRARGGGERQRRPSFSLSCGRQTAFSPVLRRRSWHGDGGRTRWRMHSDSAVLRVDPSIFTRLMLGSSFTKGHFLNRKNKCKGVDKLVECSRVPHEKCKGVNKDLQGSKWKIPTQLFFLSCNRRFSGSVRIRSCTCSPCVDQDLICTYKCALPTLPWDLQGD